MLRPFFGRMHRGAQHLRPISSDKKIWRIGGLDLYGYDYPLALYLYKSLTLTAGALSCFPRDVHHWLMQWSRTLRAAGNIRALSRRVGRALMQGF